MTKTRAQCLAGERCQPETLLEALHHQVHHSKHDARSLADSLNVRHGWLCDLSNEGHRDARRQLAIIAPLTMLTADFSVLDFLERAVGRVAFVIPESHSSAGVETFEALADAMSGLGIVSEELRAAYRDDRVTDEEFARFIGAVDRLLAAVARLRAIVGQHVAPERPPQIARDLAAARR